MSTFKIKAISSLLESQPLDSKNYQKSRRLINLLGYLPLPRKMISRPVDIDGVPGEMIHHKDRSYQRYFIYLHGGAFVTGGIASHRRLVAEIAKAGYSQGLLVDYRLAPEHPYPAALEDADKAYKWLLNQGIDPKDIAFAGDSAGGGLALALIQKLKAEDRPLPAFLALICPWLDLTCASPAMESNHGRHAVLTKEDLLRFAGMYAGNLELSDPKLSPLFGDLTGLPRLLIQAGGKDPLRDDATRLLEAMDVLRKDEILEMWPDMFHDWHLFSMLLRDGDWALRRVGQAIRVYTARGKQIEN